MAIRYREEDIIGWGRTDNGGKYPIPADGAKPISEGEYQVNKQKKLIKKLSKDIQDIENTARSNWSDKQNRNQLDKLKKIEDYVNAYIEDMRAGKFNYDELKKFKNTIRKSINRIEKQVYDRYE